jgi:hypothetical protein
MIACVKESFKTNKEAEVALKTGPTSGIVKEFLSGEGPPCLFVSKYVPRDEEVSGTVAEPILVAHTGLNGRPYATAGMAEIGRVCYFIRNAPKVKTDVAQDVNVLFGELNGDPSEAISALLQNVIRPITENIGASGKSSISHVHGFLKSLDRLTKELDETTAAMAVKKKNPLFLFVVLFFVVDVLLMSIKCSSVFLSNSHVLFFFYLICFISPPPLSHIYSTMWS